VRELNSSGEAQIESRKISSRRAKEEEGRRQEGKGAGYRREVARAWGRGDADAEESKIKYCIKRKKVVSAFQRKKKKKKIKKKRGGGRRREKKENIKCPVDRDHLTKRREASFEILLSAFFVR